MSSMPRAVVEGSAADARTALEALDQAVAGMLPDELPEVLGSLSRIQATALLRIAQTGRGAQHDELVDLEEAARILSMEPAWLYAHSRELPFVVRTGRTLRFSRAKIDLFIKRGGKRGLR